jgi:GTP-binding protein
VKVIDARFITSAPRVDALPPPELPEAAFVGRSNVGKSSLISTLLGRKKLVRISRRPGCTQMLNLFSVKTDEGPLSMMDLPGYGYAATPIEERRRWGPLITEYLRDRASLCLVVALIDIRRKLGDDDRGLFEMLDDFGRPVAVVTTKIDKLSKSKRKPALTKLEKDLGVPTYPFSAKTGEGTEDLWRLIGRACGIV